MSKFSMIVGALLVGLVVSMSVLLSSISTANKYKGLDALAGEIMEAREKDGKEAEALGESIVRTYLDGIGESGLMREWPKDRSEGLGLSPDDPHLEALSLLRKKLGEGYTKAFTAAACQDSDFAMVYSDVCSLVEHQETLGGMVISAEKKKFSTREMRDDFEMVTLQGNLERKLMRSRQNIETVKTVFEMAKQWPGLTPAQCDDLNKAIRIDPSKARAQLKELVRAKVDELIKEKGREVTDAERHSWWNNNWSTVRLFKEELASKP